MLALILALAAIALYCRVGWFSLPLLAAVISLNGVSVPVGINLELPQLIICVLLAIWAISGKIRLRGFYDHAWFLALAALWIGYLAFSALTSVAVPTNEPETVGSHLGFVNISVFYLLWLALNLLTIAYLLHAIRTEERLITIIDAVLKGAIVVSVYTIFQYMAMSYGFYSPWIVFVPNEEYLATFNIEGNRALGLSREPLYLASYLILVIPLLATLLISRSKKTALSRPTLSAGLALAIVALALTKSTGGFIAVLAALLFLVFAFGILQKRVLALGAVAAMGLLVTFSLNSGFYVARIKAMVAFLVHRQDATLYSSYERVHSFVEATEVIGQYLWTGTGIGRAPYFLSLEQVHNGYLNAMLETGLIGLALLASLLLYPLLRTAAVMRRRGRRATVREYPWLVGLAAGLVGILTQLLSYYAYMQTLIWFFIGLMLAGLAILREQQGRVPAPSPARGDALAAPPG